jgi:group I intron endonuclease
MEEIGRRQPGVYCISHRESGLIYIGSSINMAGRWTSHKRVLRAGYHHSIRLQSAWITSGPAAFTFMVLESVPDIDQLLAREQYWLDHLQPTLPEVGYNICASATGCLGRLHSEETKAAIRLGHLGRKVSDEGRANMRAAWELRRMVQAPFRHSDASKKRMSEAQQGHSVTPEARAAISAALMGGKLSTTHIANMSAALRGLSKSEEHKAKIAAAHTGQKRSLEARAAMSLAARRRTIRTAC